MENINSVIQRIQPLMDSLDLDNMSPSLAGSISKMASMTGMATPDYAQRLLVLSDTGVISNEEYTQLVMHFHAELNSELPGHYLPKTANNDSQHLGVN